MVMVTTDVAMDDVRKTGTDIGTNIDINMAQT
jgi:hypothetical protein